MPRPRASREVEEPQKVVRERQNARAREGRRGERDVRPCVREVLQVDGVCDDGEEGLGKREGVGEVEEDVEGDDGLCN